MPELPEVQTVVNSIQAIKGLSFKSLNLLWERTLKNTSENEIKNKILNKEILSIKRKAKFIVFEFNNVFLLTHLRMTGSLSITKNIPKDKKHVRAIFKLSNGFHLVYEDMRKFGGFYIYYTLDELDNRYGIDPLNPLFTNVYLYKQLKTRERMIKGLLLDQSIISGLGNIYIDESLWIAKIHPNSKSNKISLKKTKLLRSTIINILKESIKHHGTTIRDFTYDTMKTGTFRTKLNVYGRNKKPCKICLTTIKKIKSNSRGTHFCPKCQKLK